MVAYILGEEWDLQHGNVGKWHALSFYVRHLGNTSLGRRQLRSYRGRRKEMHTYATVRTLRQRVLFDFAYRLVMIGYDARRRASVPVSAVRLPL